MGTTATPPAAVTSSHLINAFNVGLQVTIFAISALAFPLAVAPAIGLTNDQRTTWILGLYLLPAIASFAMTYYYKRPLVIGWSGPAIIFLASVAASTGYPEMLGAMLVTGVVLIVLGASGLTAKLAPFIPAPIVFGVVAGSILPFLINAFTFLGDTPRLIGAVLVTWLVVRKFLEPRVPSVLAAFGAGLIVAWLSGDTSGISSSSVIPAIELTRPEFSLTAIITIVPVFVILIAANSNLSGSVVIKNAGYDPPRRTIDVVSGVGVLGGTFFGTIPLALATNITAMTTTPEAGEHSRRHWGVYVAAVGFLLIAGAAAIAADLPNLIPMELLLSVAALAMLAVFIPMLGQVTNGPIKVGPVVALAVALSDLSLFGFGSFFWALVFGTFVTRFLEPTELAAHCAMVEDAERWCR